MRAIIFVALFVSVCAKDFKFGIIYNNYLISLQKVEAEGILLTKVEKDYIYIDPKDSIIEGVVAYDLWHTEAEVNVTAGGVGESHVTLHLQSEIGIGLNYAILVFIE
ncbi:unnamed protein product [Pieris macdunnoughi]|uniref:Uncharacterized protein n=1 Tax=Pieris macdunnoughi TaxID=345717 RepID=A0A821V4P3_9NEOP|nr:unnamed protein product [Pieris macdunnoughi]